MLDRYNIIDDRDVRRAGAKMERHLEEKAKLAALRQRSGKVRTAVRTVEDDSEEGASAKRLSIQ
jgi:hypothetical protein